MLFAELRVELREIGGNVASEATKLFSEIDEYTAKGFKARVRPAGVLVVENTRRKTTGEHPEYGALMMRKALLPARSIKMEETTERFELAMDRTFSHLGFGH